MIRREFAPATQLFRVTLGSVSVLVQAGDKQQAVHTARHALCQDLPRLWDVIHAVEEDRFRVELL
jgi:hypothetical protein